MSCYLVQPRLIAMLANQITTMQANSSFVEKKEHYQRAKELAYQMARENVLSFIHRYGKTSAERGEMYEENEAFIKEVENLTDITPREFFDVSPIQWIKSIQCLEYQSCEHWVNFDGTHKRGYYSDLIRKFIDLLPGYNDALWGMPEAAKDQPVDIRYL